MKGQGNRSPSLSCEGINRRLEMKKRVLCISLILSLMLAIVLPATATADGLEAFQAQGTVFGIDQGVTKAAGNSGRWIVGDRNLFGVFLGGSLGGPVPFTMTYHANIESTTSQAGNLQGVLVVGDYELNVTGSTAPAVPISGPYQEPGFTIPGVPGTFSDMWLMDFVLELDGSWAMIRGSVGNGTLEGDIVVRICVDTVDTNPVYAVLFGGHIVGFKPGDSSFSLNGHWSP
jgi:hypothetical protein